MKLKTGDRVVVIAGKDKGKEGNILGVDPKKGRVIVDKVNMITKHQKPGAQGQGGIIQKEAALHVSNVMYLHNGKPVRLGVDIVVGEKDGVRVTTKKRVAIVDKQRVVID
ncbi:MAG TPA: 50S ribosomal protein L24 [Epulopiscium sp.]|nr:50S ribosomal protein L24 [Candidatus Epulonipiscium sp.]